MLVVIVDKECLDEEVLNRLQISEGVIGLGPACGGGVGLRGIGIVLLLRKRAFLVLSGALFEEDLAQDLFLLLVGVVVLDVVIARGIEHRVVVVVAVRISVPDLLVNGFSARLASRPKRHSDRSSPCQPESWASRSALGGYL